MFTVYLEIDFFKKECKSVSVSQSCAADKGTDTKNKNKTEL